MFRHLKLEIALAIPASNERKMIANNSAGLKGVKLLLLIITSETGRHTNPEGQYLVLSPSYLLSTQHDLSTGHVYEVLTEEQAL